MNVVIMTGRLTRDPEVRASQSTSVARFSLAVNRRFKREGQPDADFINCIAFGKSAEFVEKYFTKGMKAEVRGSWQTGSYKKDDGTTVYTNDCVVDEITFAESKNAEAKPAVGQLNSSDGFISVPDGLDEDLPFI